MGEVPPELGCLCPEMGVGVHHKGHKGHEGTQRLVSDGHPFGFAFLAGFEFVEIGA